jgi:hypothetical protein
VRKSWEPLIHGTCMPPGPTSFALAGFTILCDVMIIILPIPLLLSLNIQRTQKVGLVCLFLLGLFTTVCSIMRLTVIPVIAWGNGDSTMLVLWGTIEFNVGVSESRAERSEFVPDKSRPVIFSRTSSARCRSSPR